MQVETNALLQSFHALIYPTEKLLLFPKANIVHISISSVQPLSDMQAPCRGTGPGGHPEVGPGPE